jgi:ribosomal protein L37E
MNGPAYLAINEGVAHKKRACPDYQNAQVTATANEGEIIGFAWCEKCGSGTFFPEGEDCVACGMPDAQGRFHYCPYEAIAEAEK